MRLKLNHRPGGSALLIALLTAFVVGLMLTSYLSMVSNQNRSTMRSLAWNAAVPVMEAGVEEALTHLRYTSGITNLSMNGWTNAGGGWYAKQHWLDSGSYYDVAIRQVEPPVIISTAYVPAPLSYTVPFNEFIDKRLASGPSVGMILGQAITPSPTTGQYIKRRVRLTTARNSLYRGAMVSVTSVNLNGNGITTDSYDSTSDVFSLAGKWDPTIPKRDRGNVGCNGAIINIGNAKIMGHVGTGPGGNTTWGANGSIGDVAWVTAATPGAKEGWVTQDFHADASAVPEPYSPSDSVIIQQPGTTNINGTTYTFLNQDGAKYSLTSFPSPNVYVTGNVTVRLSGVSDAVTLGNIVFADQNATLKLYVAAASTTVSGAINSRGRPIQFQYYGLPHNTAYKASGNSEFVGCIYAPKAAFSLGGGGSTDLDFVGSCVVDTVNMGGHFKFHFDESLERNIFLGYVAISWNEIDPNGPLY